MKKHQQSAITFLLLLLLALACSALPHAGAQTQRERTVTATRPTPTPSPLRTGATPRATPSSASTPFASPSPLPAQTPVPTPTATPLPTPIPPAPQTLEELRMGIRELLDQPSLVASLVAVKIASLDTGRTIFEENAGKWMQPASNMKIYTVAAALDRLSPEFRFNTSVYASARPDSSGKVRGDLTVYGRGDPTYATRFTGGTDYYKAIDELAARIVAAGVRRVEGDLVGDESYFAAAPFGSGWEWDDLQWNYGAEVSALTILDNAVDLTVKPGARVGDSCTITIGPATTLVNVVNRTRTTTAGTRRELRVYRPLSENVVEVSGSLPVDDKGFNESIAVSRPAMLFTTMLRTALERQGVTFKGRTRTINARAYPDAEIVAPPSPSPSVAPPVEIASRQSPPLSLIAAQTMKPSQNLYTELILRALGKATATDPKLTSDAAGIAAVKLFLTSAGVNAEKVLMEDGSGLSRDDRVTAEATLQLLVYMSRHAHATVFRDSMPVAGVDGTLRNRMKGTAAAGNARAKTGTLGSANSLSGYVTSAAGERLVFSVMVNNPPRDVSATRTFIDPIVVLLASFVGRT